MSENLELYIRACLQRAVHIIIQSRCANGNNKRAVAKDLHTVNSAENGEGIFDLNLGKIKQFEHYETTKRLWKNIQSQANNPNKVGIQIKINYSTTGQTIEIWKFHLDRTGSSEFQKLSFTEWYLRLSNMLKSLLVYSRMSVSFMLAKEVSFDSYLSYSIEPCCELNSETQIIGQLKSQIGVFTFGHQEVNTNLDNIKNVSTPSLSSQNNNNLVSSPPLVSSPNPPNFHEINYSHTQPRNIAQPQIINQNHDFQNNSFQPGSVPVPCHHMNYNSPNYPNPIPVPISYNRPLNNLNNYAENSNSNFRVGSYQPPNMHMMSNSPNYSLPSSLPNNQFNRYGSRGSLDSDLQNIPVGPAGNAYYTQAISPTEELLKSASKFVSEATRNRVERDNQTSINNLAYRKLKKSANDNL